MLQLKVLNTTLSAFDFFNWYSVHTCDMMLMEAKINTPFWQRLVPTFNK